MRGGRNLEMEMEVKRFSFCDLFGNLEVMETICSKSKQDESGNDAGLHWSLKKNLF